MPDSRQLAAIQTKEPLSYYHMSHNYNLGNRPGVSLVNLAALLKGSNTLVLGPARPPLDERLRLGFVPRGFPVYGEKPLFLIDRALGRPPRDLEECYEYWLVSAELKAVFEAVDPHAFAFCDSDTVLPDGSPGPEYWICDVLPMLDAVDEANSTSLRIKEEPSGWRYYAFNANTRLALRPSIVANRHIFRLRYSWTTVLIDDVMKNACKKARMQGIYLQDATHSVQKR